MTQSNQNMPHVLRSVVKMLASTVNREEPPCLLMSDRENYQESMLFGTKESFINLAIWCLKFVDELDVESTGGDLDCTKCARDDGQIIGYSNSIKGEFDELGEVWPIVAYLCKSPVEHDQIEDALSKI